ncbi:hypothetical protein BLA29_007339, partial [Euroglyphus maynei]
MRGMRTHVRVHTEELASTGSFEEDFIVQNTDLPEPSIGRRSSHGNSLTNPARQRRRSNNVDAQLLSSHSNASISSNETFDSVIRMHKEINGSLASASIQHQQQLVKDAIDVLMGVDLTGGRGGGRGDDDISETDLMINVKSKSPTPNKLLNGCIPTTLPIDCSSSSSSTLTNNIKESKQKSNESSLNKSLSLPNVNVTPGKSSTTTTSATKTTTGSTNNNDLDSKYCSACNISFTYRNSYLAHK